MLIAFLLVSLFIFFFTCGWMVITFPYFREMELHRKAKDELPEHKAAAVFCPSYCLRKNSQELTIMSKKTVERGIGLVVEGKAREIIFSNAYRDHWSAEARPKLLLASTGGLKPNTIHLLTRVENTHGEVAELKATLEDISGKSLIVVAEFYHMPRLLRIMRKVLPGVELFPVHVYLEEDEYEKTAEPSWVKSQRAGYSETWIMWNIILYHLTPLVSR